MLCLFRSRFPLLCSVAVLILIHCGGCGSEFDVAPVSGVVTLDGQPLQGATVVFAPSGNRENRNPGPFSTGTTDANGKYELILRDGSTHGAIVGNHKVGISLPETTDADVQVEIEKYIKDAQARGVLHEVTPDEIDRIRDAAKRQMQRIPTEYNKDSRLRFEVKGNNVNTANFDLTTSEK